MEQKRNRQREETEKANTFLGDRPSPYRQNTRTGAEQRCAKAKRKMRIVKYENMNRKKKPRKEEEKKAEKFRGHAVYLPKPHPTDPTQIQFSNSGRTKKNTTGNGKRKTPTPPYNKWKRGKKDKGEE